MAEKNTMNLIVSFEELKKNIDTEAKFKKYFEQNSFIDDEINPFNLPYDGGKIF